MSRVLFVNGPMQGHINPTLPLVKELVARGEEVVYFCTREYKGHIEKAGAIFREYDLPSEQLNLVERKNLFALLYNFTRLNIMVCKSVLKQIKNESYDYIIHDSILGAGRQLGSILKLPTICSSTSFPFAKESKNAYRNAKNKQLRIGFSGIPYLLKLSAMNRKFSREYNIGKSHPMDVLFQKGDLNIVYTSRLFQVSPDSFDDSFKFVGPSIGARDEAYEFPFELLEGRKVIYIASGSTISMPHDFYNNCFEAFKDMDAAVVLSVGKKFDASTLSNIPSNFIIKNFVPQLEILKRAGLFISHGGMNSVSESLYYNVPLVVIPVCADHPVVADRIEQLGAGISLGTEAVNSKNLRSAAEKIFSDNKYKLKCREIGDSFKAAGGYKKAADCIFEFKKSRVQCSVLA